MSTIIDFINARLAEDEQIALAAQRFTNATAWRFVPDPHGGHHWAGSIEDQPLPGTSENQIVEGVGEVGWAQHIVRHDPGSVLRRVAAIRAALAEIDREEESLMHNSANPFDGLGMRACDEKRGFRLAKSILLDGIATFWATHPDYRPGWNSFGVAT